MLLLRNDDSTLGNMLSFIKSQKYHYYFEVWPIRKIILMHDKPGTLKLVRRFIKRVEAHQKNLRNLFPV